ncbi:MAG: hypothetical protein ACI8UR_001554 [Natronomonas sp.]|jgi:hypothetical protein|uniref:hypothetical protein n=1 Tax=Natronomonas sp. TaxID=2184060 RepID=UPI003989E7DC
MSHSSPASSDDSRIDSRYKAIEEMDGLRIYDDTVEEAWVHSDTWLSLDKWD